MDNWPLAIIILDALGGTPVYRYPPSGVTGDGEPPLEVDMLKFDGSARQFFDGLYFEEFDCGNWMASGRIDGLAPGQEPLAG